MSHWIDKLVQLDACSEAVMWSSTFETLDAAWAACERGDWMLWLLGKLAGPPESDARKPLVLAACACARLALKYVPKDEIRPLVAIETAERWARGEATIEEVRKARRADAAATAAATAAAYATAVAYATYAATAAAYAAYAAYAAAAAAYAADAAAYAAYTAAAAAYAADAAAAADAAVIARKLRLKKCADIVRERYPKAPQL